MKILLIEDDADLRKVLAYALRQQSWTVLPSGNGLPALQLARTMRPDLALLDVGWSDPTGLTVLYHLGQHSTVPVLTLTTLDDPDHLAECLRLGAADVLVMPVPLQHLVQRLRGLQWRSRQPVSMAPRLPA